MFGYQTMNNNNVTSFLNQSMEDIPLIRARYNDRITDEQRIDLSLNELNQFKKEVDAKAIATECKAKWLRLLNGVFSLLIIACSATIVGLQAASECINIPVIVLSAVIFVVEGTNKLFKLGQQGVLQKHGTIQLKRLSRQARSYMYSFYKYTTDQLLALTEQLRNQFDDIDATLYTSSITGTTRFHDGGLDIEHGAGSHFNIPPGLELNGISTATNTSKNDSSPHVHIHIDNTPASSPIVPRPNLQQRHNSNSMPPIKNIKTMGSTDNTPVHIPLRRATSMIDSMPTIIIESDEDY